MTHEELLAKIDDINSAIFDKDSDIPKEVVFYHNQLARKIAGTGVVYAIHKVIELHKPVVFNTLTVCYECAHLRRESDPVIIWPCPTIQAIEEQLK